MRPIEPAVDINLEGFQREFRALLRVERRRVRVAHPQVIAGDAQVVSSSSEPLLCSRGRTTRPRHLLGERAGSTYGFGECVGLTPENGTTPSDLGIEGPLQ